MNRSRKVLMLMMFLIAACQTTTTVSQPGAASPGAPAVVTPAPSPVSAAPAGRQTHELLNSVLWIQASTEYRAACIGTFVAAQRMMDRALADPNWTAALEQQGGSVSSLPPAVIVDVDETVLDNSAYEARLIRNGRAFESDTWNAWVNEADALAVPGAVEFAKYAASRGVTIFYITNRTAQTEEGTRRNLQAVGFPLPASPDVVLLRDEKPEWRGDKTSRRAHVAAGYRVLLLIGDNLGDFMPDEGVALAQRLASVETTRERWGTSWFMIANPMYGTWESAIFGHQRGLPDAEQLSRKRQALDPRE